MSDLISYDLIKALSVLTAGRVRPPLFQDWAFLGHRDGNNLHPPPVGADGIDVSDALIAYVGARLSPGTLVRRQWLKVNLADAGETYGVNFFRGTAGAFEVTAAGSADLATVIGNLQTAFDGSGAFGSIGGVASQPAGTSDLILLTYTDPGSGIGNDFPNQHLFGTFEVGQGTVTGTTYQSLIVEASRCSFQVWGRIAATGEWVLTQRKGHVEYPQSDLCVDCGGYDRLYLQITDADGLVLPYVRQGVLDSEQAAQNEVSQNALADREAELLVTSNLPGNYKGRGPESDLEGYGRAMMSPSFAPTTRIVRQEQVSVTGTYEMLMPYRNGRKGFYIVADANNANDIRVRWRGASNVAVSPSAADFVLAPGAIFNIAGPDVPSNELVAASAAAGPDLIQVVEWV